jgi:putative hemolysin
MNNEGSSVTSDSRHQGVGRPGGPIPLRIIKGFRCKVPIAFETDKFLVKTVETTAELKRVLKLRYEIYYRELIDRSKLLRRIDRDKFDSQADHLAVIEKASGEVVATYRLFSSSFSKRFYSETEFDIETIRALPDDKIELGRACVRKDYRKGVMMILLWRAISLYLQATKARYLFGCSSVKTVSIPEIAKVYAILSREHLAPELYRVYPKAGHKIRRFEEHTRVWDNVELVDPKRTISDMIPPLLHLYLEAGSMICGEPALDRSFKCADLLTLLDIERMPPHMRKRYGV